MNPTLIGLFAVIVWGMSLPFTRICEEHFGILAVMGAIFTGSGALGLLNNLWRRKGSFDRAVFLNPFLYGRGVFFSLHEILIMSAIVVVRKDNVPIVILINYLWPTAIILCSVLLAGVRIMRWWAFGLGSLVVLASLSIEMLGPHGFSGEVFTDKTDCLAYVMAFVGAISWGLYCALSRRAGEATGGGTVIPFFQLTLALALPLSFLPGYATWENLKGWWYLLLGGYCILQFLAYLSWDFGMRKGNIVALSLCADFIPWLSLFTSYLLLGVTLENKTIIAAISLVAGAMITRYGTLQKEPFVVIAKDDLEGA